MTRFDANDPSERQLLFADAIRAHRARESPYLSIETEADGENDEDGEHAEPTPWIQFGNGVVNLDCTDDELDRLKGLLSSFPAFSIEELTRPEDAEGTNVRITALADESRIAQFLEDVFRTVYELPEEYRAWIAET